MEQNRRQIFLFSASWRGPTPTNITMQARLIPLKVATLTLRYFTVSATMVQLKTGTTR